MAKRIIVIIVVLLVTIGYSFYQKKILESQIDLSQTKEEVLKQLPLAVFETLEGKPYDVLEWSEKTHPELIVIHFWGTWCAPCEAELPELLSFIKQFEGRSGVKFLLVAVNDEIHKVKKQIKSLGISKDAQITWLIDNKNIHRELFGTTRVPETYVFSSGKSILRKFSGPQEWNKAMFFQIFDEFLVVSTRKL